MIGSMHNGSIRRNLKFSACSAQNLTCKDFHVLLPKSKDLERQYASLLSPKKVSNSMLESFKN